MNKENNARSKNRSQRSPNIHSSLTPKPAMPPRRQSHWAAFGNRLLQGTGSDEFSIEENQMDVKNCKPMKEQVSDYVIYDIFLRLPAESLARLRSVSENWRDIIDSLSFANKLLSTQAAAADEEPHIPLVDDKDTAHSFTSDSDMIEEMPILELSEECNAVEDIANGLLFFRNKWNLGEFFICNPLKGEVLEIPQPLAISTGIVTCREHAAFYGMGFDCKTDSYKIVWACELPRFGLSCRLPRSIVETKVYTLGTASWRVISLLCTTLSTQCICMWRHAVVDLEP